MTKDNINVVRRKITNWGKIFELCAMYKKLQSILIICRFYISEFMNLLKFICNQQIDTCGAFIVIQSAQRNEIFNHPTCTFPADIKQVYILSYFSAPMGK